MRKKSAGWMDKIYKKFLWRVVYQHKKQLLSKVSACCRCSLPSLLLVGIGLLARCNFNNQYYVSGLFQVQQTAQMVGYRYNKYECQSKCIRQACLYAHLYIYDCWLDATVKYMGNAIVTDMADGRVQM